MYELSNKPTAIPAFLNAKCMFSNAINELAQIGSRILNWPPTVTY